MRLLGRGAMGSVYLADDASGQRVALKLLSPELAHDDRFLDSLPNRGFHGGVLNRLADFYR